MVGGFRNDILGSNNPNRREIAPILIGGSDNEIGRESNWTMIMGGDNNRIGTNCASTVIAGGTNNVHTKIMFTRSTTCGATWSNPAKLSERVAKNQGTTIAVDPGTGAIHIAWREFATAGDSTSRRLRRRSSWPEGRGTPS